MAIIGNIPYFQTYPCCDFTMVFLFPRARTSTSRVKTISQVPPQEDGKKLTPPQHIVCRKESLLHHLFLDWKYPWNIPTQQCRIPPGSSITEIGFFGRQLDGSSKTNHLGFRSLWMLQTPCPVSLGIGFNQLVGILIQWIMSATWWFNHV
jgi:hypothetical protein